MSDDQNDRRAEKMDGKTCANKKELKGSNVEQFVHN
jgi:hypothetical protein